MDFDLRRRHSIAAGMILALLPGLAAAEVGFDDFSELSLEDLLNQEVVTASRRAQKIREAPVITYVVTREDIRVSGARSIPDALRMVPGFDVLSPVLSHSSVSARGMNEIAANSMMILINGRSINADIFRAVLWEMLPVGLNEVEKIEVTRSPGSALYGANAFAGVINIITDDPGEGERVSLTSTATEYGSALVDAQVSGRHHDRLAYRLNLGYRHVGQWGASDHVAETPRVSAAVRYDLSETSTLSFEGGHAEGNALVVPSSQGSEVNATGNVDFLRADWARGGTRVRTFWNHYNMRMEPVGTDVLTALTEMITNSIDVEAYHSMEFGEDHSLVAGTSYRNNMLEWAGVSSNRKQDIYGVFANHEWRAMERVILSMGLRYDDHPLVGGQLSPRGSVVVSAHQHHTLRASIGRAHRNPTHVENYFYLETQWPGSPLPLVVRGNTDLESEQITAYEMGYQGLLDENLMVSVDLYHHRARGAVELATAATFPSPPAPAPGIPSEMSFANVTSTNASGGEISAEWNPTSKTRLKGYYAYVWLENHDTGARMQTTPRYKASLSLTVRPNYRSTVHLASRYVSRTEFDYSREGALLHGSASDYVALDVNTTYELIPARLDLGIGVQNLTDRRYREYPVGLEFRRLAYGSLSVRF